MRIHHKSQWFQRGVCVSMCVAEAYIVQCCYWSSTYSQVLNAKQNYKYSTIEVKKSLLRTKQLTGISIWSWCRLWTGGGPLSSYPLYFWWNSCFNLKSVMHLEPLKKQKTKQPYTALWNVETLLFSGENGYDFRYKAAGVSFSPDNTVQWGRDIAWCGLCSW